ncbi:sugar transferase [Marinilactibacillus sp. Marseille-P9653]|uniref:sugar transferase n=1 Tax=Marinilactibacillus sp. Marseille-P9653 TaxID=2866583 RepID=UPI001CE3E24A|nr:sugar transferase [Marinilactibacillus sp. Marseille-P9653]
MKEHENLESEQQFLSDNINSEEELISLEQINKNYLYQFIKRVTDVIGSFLGSLILLPIFFIIAIFIKLEDPKGPVLFVQTRIGKNGKKFKIFKFRSMSTDAEIKLLDLIQLNEVEGAMFKIKEDPRVTRVGKFIRKTSLDELPQLWNVLKGDMSLVGPRPPLEKEVDIYSTYEKQRLLIKPGCTGPWQVSGRNNISFEEMVQIDLDYINTRNILMDVKIILKTVLIMIKPNGAY